MAEGDVSTWVVTIPDEVDDRLVPALYKFLIPKENWGDMFKVVFNKDSDVLRGVKVTSFSDPDNGVHVEHQKRTS